MTNDNEIVGKYRYTNYLIDAITCIQNNWDDGCCGLTSSVLVTDNCMPIISTDFHYKNEWVSSEYIVLKKYYQQFGTIPACSTLVSTNFGLTSFKTPVILKDFNIQNVYTGYMSDNESFISILPWLCIKTTNNAIIRKRCLILENKTVEITKMNNSCFVEFKKQITEEVLNALR
jgi:hypothetical protein